MTDSAGVMAGVNASHMARLEEAKRDERGFIANATASAADNNLVSANGGTVNLHLKNPSGSGVSAEVIEFIPAANFSGWFRVYDSFDTAPSGGTADGIDNLLMDTNGGANSGNMTVNQDVSFTETADAEHFETVIPAGGVTGNQVGGVAMGTPPILEPGREIVMELENVSGADAPASIGVVYIEHNEVFSN